jgi:DNA-binding PadR family transcriptional regulator
MNDNSSDRWERPRHHHHDDGARARKRFGPRGYPDMPGYDPADDEPGPRRRHAHPSGPPGYGRFGGPEFARKFGPEFGDRDFGPGFGGPGFEGPEHHGPGFGGPEFHKEFHKHPGHGPWNRGHGRRGGRARRGDVRAAALALIAEEPVNGYQVIQQIAERSGGLWRPSPGSVYPALAQLEDEGLITQREGEGGRRAYALTDAGTAYVAEHAQELNEPWSALAGDGVGAIVDMKMLVRQVHMAAGQVATAGTDAQLTRARAVLAQARRALYRILAEDDEAAAEQAGQHAPADAAAADSAPADPAGTQAGD